MKYKKAIQLGLWTGFWFVIFAGIFSIRDCKKQIITDKAAIRTESYGAGYRQAVRDIIENDTIKWK